MDALLDHATACRRAAVDLYALLAEVTEESPSVLSVDRDAIMAVADACMDLVDATSTSN